MCDKERELMDEEERDIVEFTDEDGNTLSLEVLDYFFYNGEEFAVLGDAEESCECCSAQEEEEEDECDCEHSLYIMKVVTSTDENGDELEEFIPVEEGLMDQLIEIVQTRFEDDDDEDCDDEDEDGDDEDGEEDDE
jgi:hypothetical protein